MYEKEFYDLGLIRSIIPNRRVEDFSREIRSIWLRLTTNPNLELCTIINHHITQLRKRYMIGVQLRFGGWMANFHERPMISKDALNVAKAKVVKHVKQNKLKWENVHIFLSTDSDTAVDNFKKYFNTIAPGSLYLVDNFTIGHSAAAKTHNQEKWESVTKRAILDMLILKESDFFIYSKRSSFGKFALELQKSYNISVDVDAHMRKMGMTCSVYHKRNSIGLDVGI